MEELWNTIVRELTASGMKLVWGLVVLVLGLILIHFINKLIAGKSGKIKRLDPGITGYMKGFLRIIMYVVLFLTVASIWGVPLTSFVTILASASVAISLALQGVLSNFIGGILLLVLKPFQVGDYVRAEPLEGTVSEISILYTKLNTFDNKGVVLPNSSLINTALVNYSAQKTRRVDLTFSVSYHSDIDQVKAVLAQAAKDSPATLAEPAPVIGLAKHNESSLDFALKVWCNTPDYWSTYFDLNERVKKYFDREHIEIPYPQMDVHMKKGSD
ncbi:MAG: mechanosensitive ion channel family protein [Clostridia bacterium]|nr:mechanosensitive ion channel family protein [Clostridia bacterium]